MLGRVVMDSVNAGKLTMNKCYMCDAAGTTKEHAPPDCFFPKGYRAGLWTVPSCDAHNSRNSKDVEYVRNVITSHISGWYDSLSREGYAIV
jgi:hypothetical protein